MLPQLAGSLCFHNNLQKTATGMCVFIHVFVVIVLICSNYPVITGLGPFTNQEKHTQLRCRPTLSKSVLNAVIGAVTALLRAESLVTVYFITSGCYITRDEVGVFLVHKIEKQKKEVVFGKLPYKIIKTFACPYSCCWCIVLQLCGCSPEREYISA